MFYQCRHKISTASVALSMAGLLWSPMVTHKHNLRPDPISLKNWDFIFVFGWVTWSWPLLGNPQDLSISSVICICWPCILELNDSTALKLTFGQLCFFKCFFKNSSEKIGVDDLIGVVIPVSASAEAAFDDQRCIVSPCVRIFSQDPSDRCTDWPFQDIDDAAQHQANKATAMHGRQIVPWEMIYPKRLKANVSSSILRRLRL